MKIRPKQIVSNKPFKVWILLPVTIECRDQVKETPELSKISVFSKGIDHGLKPTIPIEGNTHPISILGARLA